MAKYLLQTLPDRANDAAGNPCPAARLHTWAAGTTTNHLTWQDQAGTTPHPNPIVADSAGLWPQIWVDDDALMLEARRSDDITVLWQRDKVIAPQAALDAFLTSLGTSSGAGLIGFDWATLYASLSSGWGSRTAATRVNVLRYLPTAKWAGYVAGTEMEAIDAYIQPAINAGVSLYFPPGFYRFGTITPKSGVTLSGERGKSWLVQVQPNSNIATGFYKASGAGSISDFHVRDLSIDGSRVASPANANNCVFWFDMGSGETASNITFDRVDFKNPQSNCIYFTASNSASGLSTGFAISHCKAWTEDASLFEGTNRTLADLVRFELTWDNATGGNGYGFVHFEHILVTHNYAEKIRTCADIKRGCQHFLVSHNRTKNMYDCHHSVDGSFFGAVTHNTGRMDSGLTIAGTFTNFAEVQGTSIDISHNVVDGGGLLVSGILVTAYGRPAESGVGHQSIKISVTKNIVRSVVSNGFRLIDSIASSITDNDVQGTGQHTATVEHSGTYTLAGGGTMVPQGNEISNVRSRSCTTGATFDSTAVGSIYGICPDENGEDFYEVSTTPGPTGNIRDGTVWAPFRNKAGYQNLNPNPFLKYSGAAIDYWTNTLTSIADAADRPNGSPAAVEWEDNVGTIPTATSNANIALTQNQRLYIRVDAKYKTATKWSVSVKEFDASNVALSTYYYGVGSFDTVGTSWKPWVCAHKAQASTCAYVTVSINPAAANGTDGATTGKTDFANVRISRLAIGAA